MNPVLLVVFLIYDLVGLRVVVKGYQNMCQNFRNESGRAASTLEKIIMLCMAVVVGMLWLPLALLSVAYSKLLK